MTQSLIILVVISLMFFLYFKVKFWRSKVPLEKKWLQSKASMSLGAFMFFFGLNLLTFPRSQVDIIIGALFSILGALNLFFSYRAYKFYLHQVLESYKK